MELVNVFEIAKREQWQQETWVIVGKGPTFANYRLAEHLPRMALNHAALALPSVRITHCIDVEVIAECGAALLDHTEYLLMPWQPNERFRRSLRILASHVKQSFILQQFASEERLLWYNRAGSQFLQPGSPAVSVRYFSAEAAVGILGQMGVKQIFTAGVDGGTNYANEFSDLTPLTNGQPNFERQFPELEHITRKFGIQLVPLVDPAAGQARRDG